MNYSLFLMNDAVTDQIGDEAASLQGILGNEDHFCFLVKIQDDKTISVNGKAKNQSNLDSIMEEMKSLFQSSL